jgi:hypothetical protein
MVAQRGLGSHISINYPPEAFIRTKQTWRRVVRYQLFASVVYGAFSEVLLSSNKLRVNYVIGKVPEDVDKMRLAVVCLSLTMGVTGDEDALGVYRLNRLVNYERFSLSIICCGKI